ncbi:MAG: D-alanyl-D-alanine carboxypeptidase [Alphaproteobacteria bacterium]|nr:D-alanyl-D-alanine carboxypeptidase [Alphaproteobacteria bacterium]
MDSQSFLQKTVFLIILTIIALWSTFASASAINHTSAKQAYMIDFDTGMVLYQKNAEEKMPTSSMSKVMTTTMVFDALKQGRLSVTDKFKISEKAWRKGGSKMFVKVGDLVTIDDLLNGILVQSGNDATIVVAEGMAGSEKAFAEAMTMKAHELGMKNSNFVNASGWPEDDHYSTAHDLAIMAQHVIKTYPEYMDYFSRTEFTYSNITQKNRNPLLYRNIGADGMKTGHTEIGGYGLIGTGKTDEGRRVILVVNGLESIKDRANEGARLLQWGLNGFDNITLVSAGETITKAEVALGRQSDVNLTIKDDIFITVPKLAKSRITMNVKYNGPLTAPVSAGTEVGTLYVDIPELGTKEYPLYTAAPVAELGFFARAIAHLKMIINGETA